MLAGAKNLGDPGTTSGNKFTPNWDPAFKQDIHGVFLVTAESHDTAQATFAQIIKIFSVGAPRMELFFEVTRVVGDVRPGHQKGHEQSVHLLDLCSINILKICVALVSSMASQSLRFRAWTPKLIAVKKQSVKALYYLVVTETQWHDRLGHLMEAFSVSAICRSWFLSSMLS